MVSGGAGIHHVELWVADLPAAEPAWSWLFGTLGWSLESRWATGLSWRHGSEYLVVESGPDVVDAPYDRRRPGMNHLALRAPDRATVDLVVADGPSHGWSLLFADRHPWAGGPEHYAAYLENADGFEIEVVAEPAGC